MRLSRFFVLWAGLQAQQPPSPQTATSPQKSAAAGVPGRASKSAPKEESSVTVACNSTVELLLTDPSGKRTGGDPILQRSYDEIPSAYYESAGIEDAQAGAVESDPPKTLFISNPFPGRYRLSITGTASGTYACRLLSDDAAGAHSEIALSDIPIGENDVQKFAFEFDGKTGSYLRLSGGFTGSSNSASTKPRLLSYATGLTATIHARSVPREFPLLIFYDPRIVASTFAAELNGKTMTPLFHPKPGSWELIRIPLAKRLNRMRLAVSDEPTGAEPNMDQFEISVE